MLVGHRNTIVSHFSTGYNLLYSDSNGTKLAKNDRIRMRDDSIYDMVRLPRAHGTLRVSSAPLRSALSPTFRRGQNERGSAADAPLGQLEQDVHDGSGAAAARRRTHQSQRHGGHLPPRLCSGACRVARRMEKRLNAPGPEADMHQNNKTSITILQLMTHTSGFDADPAPPLYPKWVRVPPA